MFSLQYFWNFLFISVRYLTTVNLVWIFFFHLVCALISRTLENSQDHLSKYYFQLSFYSLFLKLLIRYILHVLYILLCNRPLQITVPWNITPFIILYLLYFIYLFYCTVGIWIGMSRYPHTTSLRAAIN